MAEKVNSSFSKDIQEGLPYADIFQQHITGKSTSNKIICLKTLKALAELNLEEIQNILMWAKQQ